MASYDRLVIGVDLGTSGVRAVAVADDGSLVGECVVARDLRSPTHVGTRHEQDPELWWEATRDALRSIMAQLKTANIPPGVVRGLAVDGTSGTVVCVGADGRPVRPAIMHNDGRASEEAQDLSCQAESFYTKLGYRIAPSFAAAKILWLQRHEPGHFEATSWFAHQSDFIMSRLGGRQRTTDYSNALKTGYDLVDDEWPGWLLAHEGIAERLASSVLAPGTPCGKVTEAIAADLGLPAGLTLVSGATDGTAAFVASGASAIGDDNTTLGTTLVLKRLTDRLAADPAGLVYSHKLPEGRWLPSAASSTGGEWIHEQYPNADLAALDAQARDRLPSKQIAYPLVGRGERFPFAADAARGFCEPGSDDPQETYAANLQGVAFMERLCYEALDSTTCVEGGKSIFATGGGSRSEIWLQLRADVSGRLLRRPLAPSSAFGSAIIAASATSGFGLQSAMERMVRLDDRVFEPSSGLRSAYDDGFGAFKQKLVERGYLSRQGRL